MPEYQIAVYTEKDSGLAYACLKDGETVLGGHGFGSMGDSSFKKFIQEVDSAKKPLKDKPEIVAEVVNMVPESHIHGNKKLSATEFRKVLKALDGK